MTARQGRIELALGRALRARVLEREDDAAVELARTYARALDAGGAAALPKIGHRFLEALVELGLTPKVRAGVLKGEGIRPTKSPLDELRAKREAKAGSR